MDGTLIDVVLIMRCGIVSSCQSAATSEIVKRSWARVHRGPALYQVPDLYLLHRRYEIPKFCTSDLVATLTLIPWPSSQFICSRLSYVINQGSVKFRLHWFVNIVLIERTDARTHEGTHGPTTRKHNSSDTPIGGRRYKNIDQMHAL